jgi:hypothetical protein
MQTPRHSYIVFAGCSSSEGVVAVQRSKSQQVREVPWLELPRRLAVDPNKVQLLNVVIGAVMGG